jgi:hypothetical protein
MVTTILAAFGLGACLLLLLHNLLPPARRQRVDAWLRDLAQRLRRAPTELRTRRHAEREAQAAIARARRESQRSPGEVHDLKRFREERERRDAARKKH